MGRLSGGNIIPTLTVGNRVFTDLANLKILCAITGTTNGRATFRETKSTGTSGYTPSSTNKFRVLATKIVNGVAVACTPALAQTDNDVGWIASTAFTNPVYLGGAIDMSPGGIIAATIGQSQEAAINMLIQNGKYLSIDDNGASAAITAFAYGYEEA